MSRSTRKPRSGQLKDRSMKHSRLRLRSSRSALAAAILIFGAGSLSTAAPAFAQDAMSPSPGTPVASGLAEPIRDEGRRGDDVPVLDGASEIGRAHVELQSLMRISYAVFCLKKKTNIIKVR